MDPADYNELRYRLLIEKERYEFRLAGCVGKHGFDTPAMAHHATRHMDGNPSVFKCEFCNKWHIGSSVRPKNFR